MALSKKKEQEYIEKVKQDGMYLKRITKNQTEAICLEAVKRSGYALQYVQNQTDEICLAAVKRNGMALKYVKNQTLEICLEAVKEDGMALMYVKEQTEEICLEAVKENEEVFQLIHEKTPEMCLEAVKSKPSIINKIHIPLDDSFKKELVKISQCLLSQPNMRSYADYRRMGRLNVENFKNSPYHVLDQLYRMG